MVHANCASTHNFILFATHRRVAARLANSHRAAADADDLSEVIYDNTELAEDGRSLGGPRRTEPEDVAHGVVGEYTFDHVGMSTDSLRCVVTLH